MCGVCGCGEGETRIEAADGKKVKGEPHDHGHGHDHGHHHHEDDHHDHHHHHGHDEHDHDEHDHGHSHGEGQSRIVKIEQDLLAKNDAYAAANRASFNNAGILALNLVSSPGSGKTSLLVETINRLKGDIPVAVIEGDQQTSMDAERIRATGAPGDPDQHRQGLPSRCAHDRPRVRAS